MRKIGFISLGAMLLVLFSGISCQRKLTGYIEVKGRVLDFYNNEPLQVKVSLMADDATSAKEQTEGSISLGTVTSNSDGTFKIHTGRSRRNNYYISVEGGVFKTLSVKENQSNDLGDFFAGSHNVYCDITVIPRSDSTLHVQKNGGINDYYAFDSGTRATVQNSMTVTQANYNGGKVEFPIWYTAYCRYPAYYGTNHFFTVPVASLDSKITATIYY